MHGILDSTGWSVSITGIFSEHFLKRNVFFLEFLEEVGKNFDTVF